MQITTTAIAFLSLAAGLWICGFWFLKVWRRSENKTPTNKKISLLLTLLFANFGLQNAIMGGGAALFPGNPEALYWSLAISHFFLITAALIAVYTSYYIFSPHLSPLFPMILAGVVGVAMHIGTILDHPLPYITPAGGIEWNMSYWLSVLVFLTLFISIGGNFYIFWNLFRRAKTKEVRNLAFILALAAFLGVVNVFIRLVILENESVRTRLFDLLLATIGIIFIGALLIWPLARRWLREVFKIKTAD